MFDPAKMRGLFGTLDQIYEALGPERAQKMRSRVEGQPDATARLQRASITTFLADRYKMTSREVAERYDTTRNRFAQQAFPDRMKHGTMDDGVFFTNAGRLLKEEADRDATLHRLNVSLFNDAVDGKDFTTAFATIRNTGEIPTKYLDQANAWAIHQWEKHRASVPTGLQPVVAQAVEFFALKKAGVTDENRATFGEDFKQSREALDESLAKLDPEQRGNVLAIAAERAKSLPGRERGAAIKGLTTVLEGTEDFVGNALTSLYNSVEQLPGVSHTEAEQTRQDRYQVTRQLDRIARGEVDPIAASSTAGRYTLGFIRETPGLLANFVPGGFIANYFALKQRARESLEAQGVPGADAENVAMVQAIPQTAASFISSKMIFLGKVPGFARIDALTLGKFAAGFGAVAGTEYAGQVLVNAATQLTDAGIQNVAAALNQAVPGISWEKFTNDFKGRLPETLAMSIPGALIGTGVATFHNVQAGKRFLQQAALMDPLGFTPEAKAAVMSAPDYPTAEKAFKEGFATREPVAPPPAVDFTKMEGVVVPPSEQAGMIKSVLEMTPGSFADWANQQQGGFSNTAQKLGRALRDSRDANALVAAAEDAKAEADSIFARYKAGDKSLGNDLMALGFKEQFFREAYEAAVGEGGTIKRILSKEPDYQPPIRRNDDGTYTVQAVADAPAVVATTPEGAVMVAEAQKTEAAQQTATAAPEPRPEQDGRALPPQAISLTKEHTAALRMLFNLDALPAPERERRLQLLAEAHRTGVPARASALADDLLATGRAATGVELAGLRLRAAELVNQHEQLASEIAEAWVNGDERMAAAKQRTDDGVVAELEHVTRADDSSGTRQSRDFSSRQMAISRNDYSLVRMTQRVAAAKQGAVTPQERARLQAVETELIAERKKAADAHAALLEQQAENAKLRAATFVAEGRARRRTATAQDAAARRTSLKAELAKLGMRVNDITSIVGLSIDQARIVAQIADTYIEEGVATLQELTNKLKTDIPDLSDQDIFTAVGRQTQKEAAKIETEAKRRVKELRSQAVLWSKINRVLDGVREDGKTPINKTQQNKLLRESLRQLRNQAHRTIFDDAALARVDAKIVEIQRHLAKGTRPATATPKPDGSEKLTAAKETLVQLRQEMGATDTITELERAVTEAQPKPGNVGEPAPKPTPTEQGAKLNAMRERIAELRDQIDRAELDPAAVNAERLAKLQRLAAELETQLEEGFRPLREPDTSIPTTDAVEAARRQVRDLELLMRTEDSMADLEDQLRRHAAGELGALKVSAPEQRILTNAALENALIREKQLKRQVDEIIESLRKRTFGEKVVETLLVPRTLLTIGDLSATLRQGLLLSASRPVTASRAFVASLKSMFNENTADAIALAIERRPHALEGIKAKLYLSEHGSGLRGSEEHFVGNFAERIPGLRRVVRASNRAMVTTLNMLRVAAFDGFIEAHPEATREQRTAFAQYVNAASGRGNVKWGPDIVKKANAIFFAPRYAISRFQALYSPFKNINDPIVRNAILKDFGALLGTGLSVMYLASLAGADVGMDPSESDFGKIIVGDTRIDIWGGLLSPARLILQTLALPAQAAGLVELEKDIDPLEAAADFLKYKTSPAITVPLALFKGENVIGQEQEAYETLLRAVFPLGWQDTWDVYRNTEDPGMAAATFLGSSVGIGVQEHGPR